jgi:hypothetical protein
VIEKELHKDSVDLDQMELPYLLWVGRYPRKIKMLSIVTSGLHYFRLLMTLEVN